MKYNVLVIGSGTAGYTAAHRCRDAGLTVAVADERPFGGTCALRGCQPKKYLVANAEAVDMASHLVGQGIEAAPRTDWPELMRLKNAFTDRVSPRTVDGFREAGIDVLLGHVTFTGPTTANVDNTAVEADSIVVATGAVPRTLGIPGGELAIDSEAFLSLPALPQRIVFVGGGYISFEFAHVAASAGAEVTLLHRSDRPLKTFDPDLVSKLVESSREKGLRILLNTEPESIKESAAGFDISLNAGDPISADLVIAATGRMPSWDGLGLDAAGISHSAKGIEVDDGMRSLSNPKVFAIGDAASAPYLLATAADLEAEVAADNIIGKSTRAIDYGTVPSAVFSSPPLASVGMTEKEARASGKDVRINLLDPSDWPSSKRIGQHHAGMKVIIENESELILGAHLLGHNAAEVINIFAMAIQFGHTTRELRQVLWAYPTNTSDIKYSLV